MHDLWECFAFTPDPELLPELTAAHGHAKAVRLLDSPQQRAHRLSSVDSVFNADDEQLAAWHRRQHAR